MDARAIVGAVGLFVATCPALVRGDAAPYDEESERPVEVSLELSGLAQFPEHVFYLYPTRCTDALAALDVDGAEEVLKRSELLGSRDDFLELRDGPLAAWLADSNYCASSRIYALARSVAAEVDLAAMDPVARSSFFEEDHRLFRPDLELPSDILAVSKYAKLRSVHEVLRVRRITAAGVSLVIDAATYRFVDGTEQTLRLAHTRRLMVPFSPFAQARLDKVAAAFAAWEARQPAQPPKAPLLPAPREGHVDDDDDDEPAAPSAAPGADDPAAPVVAPAAAPTVPPVAAPTPAAEPQVAGPTTLVEETDALGPRAWLLAGGSALIAFFAGVVLARRR